MRYDAHENLVAPARPTCGLHLLIGGVILTILVYWTFTYMFWNLLFTLAPGGFGPSDLDVLDDARTPFSVIVNLGHFALLSAAVGVTLMVLHRRGLSSVIGPMPLALRQFRRVVRALILLFFVLFLLPMPEQFSPSPNLPVNTWLSFLPLTIVALLIQTSAEELAFRGYIQSQLAARYPHPLIWIGVPSVIFGLLHYDPALPGPNGLIVTVWAIAFGAAAADLTARSGSLGPAIALHMVNNFSAIAIAAPAGPFDGLALYTYPFSLASSEALAAWAPVDLMILFCSWLTARLALRR